MPKLDSGPEVSFGAVWGARESRRSHFVLAYVGAPAEAAQNPRFPQACKCLNLRNRRLGLSAARKQVFMDMLIVFGFGKTRVPLRANYSQLTLTIRLESGP